MAVVVVAVAVVVAVVAAVEVILVTPVMNTGTTAAANLIVLAAKFALVVVVVLKVNVNIVINEYSVLLAAELKTCTHSNIITTWGLKAACASKGCYAVLRVYLLCCLRQRTALEGPTTSHSGFMNQ